MLGNTRVTTLYLKEVVEKARCGAIPLLILRNPPLRLTLSSGEAAYRRAK